MITKLSKGAILHQIIGHGLKVSVCLSDTTEDILDNPPVTSYHGNLHKPNSYWNTIEAALEEVVANDSYPHGLPAPYDLVRTLFEVVTKNDLEQELSLPHQRVDLELYYANKGEVTVTDDDNGVSTISPRPLWSIVIYPEDVLKKAAESYI